MTNSKLAPKPAVFFDRDGVICEFVDELSKFEEFKFRSGISEAIRLLNQNGFLVFVATNQPNIAKAKMTLAELNRIHDHMVHELANQGALIDKVYFCPHRTAEGGGKVDGYVMDCDCRKPKAGMLVEASNEFSINKSKSFMIGDTWRDVGCAEAFGIPCLGLTGGGGFPYPADSEEALKHPPLQIFSGPLAAIQWIVKN
jgi:D-glycero-D-manno-heptose 1,7-bisphosphate phosphatase